MASGNVPDDVASICSVCLEPYKGRNPKLLPCFHTFCLPCLQDLEKHHTEISSDTTVSEEDRAENRPLTFPCPTCRAVINVPTGGVTQFQTNFYLNTKALPCDVCDRGEEAMFTCSECGHNMCDQCQRCHNTFVFNHQVQPLTCSYRKDSRLSFEPLSEGTVTEQLAVLEAALVTMREEENSLQQERKAMADVIRRRADTVRLLVTQAEEKSQRALAEVAEKMVEQIQNKITTARQKYARIVTQSFKDGQPVLLSDDDFQFYQQQCRRGIQMKTLLLEFNDCAIDQQALEAYIGKVCAEALHVGEASLPVASDVCRETTTSEQPHDLPVKLQPSDIIKVTRGIADIENQLTALDARTQERLNKVVLDLESEKRENAALQSSIQRNITVFLQNMDTFTGNISAIQMDIASMRRDFETIKADNSTLQSIVDSIKQEAASHEIETKKVKDAANDLSRDIRTLKEKSSNVVAFNARLHRDSSADGQILMKADCNVGQAYDNTTCTFTAPVTGIYFFMARAMAAQEPKYFNLDIYVDSVPFAESGSVYGGPNPGASCTVHLLQRLTKGQKVQLWAGCDYQLRSDETSFSGMLVNPEFDIM